MNRIITTTIITAFIFCTAFTGKISAGDKPLDGKGMNKPFIKEIERLKAKKSGIFNLSLDLQGGATISNTKFDLNVVDSTTQDLNNNSTKVGPSFGLLFDINFLGFGFTSGLQYSGKGFKTTSGDKANMNFLNIPLLFYFDFQISKVIIDGNLGPYFGLLMSSSDQNSPVSPYKIKSFDFGLTADIEGAYMINKYIGPLLGVKYEYGGINNLGNNEKINKTTTQTFFIYTGVKFVL